MSDRMKRTLVIETEIDRKTLNSAEQTVKDFFDKYQNKKMKIETSELRGILQPIRDIEKEIDRVAEKMPKAMQGAIKIDKQFLADIKAEFDNITATFTDGSMAKGFDAIMEKTKTLELSAVSVGEYFQSLQDNIRNTVDALKNLNTIQNGWRGKFLSFDDLDVKSLESAISAIQKLKESQQDLESFKGQTATGKEDWSSGFTTHDLESKIKFGQKALDELRSLNIATVAELNKRRDIIRNADQYNAGYGDAYISDVKAQASSDRETYNIILSELQEFIERKKTLLQELNNNSYLFSSDEISTYEGDIKSSMERVQQQIVDMKDIPIDDSISKSFDSSNFTAVVNSLNEIKSSLQTISDVFQRTEVSMSDMTKNSVESFTQLSDTITQVYNNLTQIQTIVDIISKKDFNITNITQTGGAITPPSSLAEFKQQAQETIEVLNHAKKLTDEVSMVMGKIPGERNSRNAFNVLGDFYSVEWEKEISKSKSATKLAGFQVELENYIKQFSQILKLVDSAWKDTYVPVEKPTIKPMVQPKSQVAETPTIAQPQNTTATTNAEAQQMYQLKAAIDEVSNAIGRKNNGFIKEKEIVDTSVNAEEAKLRELVGVITNEIGNALDSIKEKFAQSFVMPELNKGNIQTSFDEIYNKFVELKDKISAMKIDIGVSATNIDSVADSASKSQQSVNGEVQSAVDAAKTFVDAANAKKQFVEANKQVAESAKTSEDAVKKEAEAAKTVATDVSVVATKVAKELAKTKDVLNNDGRLVRTDETRKFTTDKAVVTETESTRIHKDGSTSVTTTIIQDFEQLTKETKKTEEAVARAQKKLDEFLARFQSKSGGNAQFIKGFSKLEGTKVTSDNMEDVFNKMIKLQEEYSKLETNFRKGQSSLNPFVNAITKSENIGNIFGDIERKFNGLTTRSDELINNFVKLEDLSQKIQGFIQLMNGSPSTITPEAFDEFSKQVGEFNVLKSQIEGSIKAQSIVDVDAEKKRKKEVEDYINLIKQRNEYEAKATKGGAMQSTYEAQAAKIQEQILANDKQSIMNQEEKNKLLAIEEAHQLKIAEIKLKNTGTGRQSFDTLHSKLQGKYDAGYLSEANWSNWQNELATYQNYLNGTVAADENIINRQKQSLTQLYDHLNKISNASRTFFASGGEILSTVFNEDEIRNVGNSLKELYDTIVAERFDGMKTSVTGVNETLGRLTFTVDSGEGALKQYTIAMDKASGATKLLSGNTKETLTTVQQFGKALKTDVRGMFSAFIGGMSGMYAVGRYFKEGIQYVRELDKALTELKKVTDETEETYDKFLGTASQMGARIGSTMREVVSSTADFARVGYSLEDAVKMAESAQVLMNVSEFTDISSATDSLISAIQAFSYTADESMHVVDIMNTIGNQYAISTADLASSLTRSSASLVAAGNTMEEAVALTAAANTIIQNSESVGNALKTVSMRIRGTSVEELQAAGEETDGVVESTSKLYSKVKALTAVGGKEGISILGDDGKYLSTYEILSKIADRWEEITEVGNDAALLEILAGKTRGSVVAALLQQPDILKNAYEDAINAEGK